jgi:hypothetical protein
MDVNVWLRRRDRRIHHAKENSNRINVAVVVHYLGAIQIACGRSLHLSEQESERRTAREGQMGMPCVGDQADGVRSSCAHHRFQSTARTASAKGRIAARGCGWCRDRCCWRRYWRKRRKRSGHRRGCGRVARYGATQRSDSAGGVCASTMGAAERRSVRAKPI